LLARYGESGWLRHPDRGARGPHTADRVRRLVAASFGLRFGCLALIVGVLVAFPLDVARGATSTLRRYPYLTDVSGANATVNWATNTSATTGSLRWGSAAVDGSCSPTSTATATRASITVNGVAEYQWKASFAAQRSTTYCYRVLLGATDLLGTDATPTFATAAGAGSSPSTFAVFGDWGKVDASGANQDQANVMRELARSGAQFAISTGDVPYGATGVTIESQYGDLFTVGNGLSAVFGPLFWTVPGRSLALFPTLGNHGMASEFLKNWPTSYTAAQSGGVFGSVSYSSGYNGVPTTSLPSAWYAFDVGNTRFYALEAAWPNSKTSTGTSPELYQDDWGFHWQTNAAEYQWLANDLATHPSQLKFAFFHFPLYSDNATESSDTWLQGPNSLEGLLGRYGVQLVFNGHAHIYERNVQQNGIVSYVTGGGGATPEPVSGCSAFDAYAIGWSSSGGSSCHAPRPTAASQVYHFLLVSVNGTNVTVTPTDELGRTFDVQTYSFGGAPPPDATPPSKPVVTATPTSTSITLTWPRATDNVGVSRYEVSRGGAIVGTIGQPASGTVSFMDTGRTPSTTYSYVVTASDAAGNSTPSDAVVVTTSAAGGGGTATLTTTADAKVDASLPTTNYATAALRVDASPDVRSYMKFDASALTGTVQSATLRIWATSAQSVGFDVYGVGNSSWSETAITYANQPSSSISATKLGSSGTVAAGAWKTVDVTALLSGPGIYSVVLESTSSTALALASRGDAAHAPQLVVTTT
jgi:hypothetical protein